MLSTFPLIYVIAFNYSAKTTNQNQSSIEYDRRETFANPLMKCVCLAIGAKNEELCDSTAHWMKRRKTKTLLGFE